MTTRTRPTRLIDSRFCWILYGIVAVVPAVFPIAGCARYVTPGPAAELGVVRHDNTADPGHENADAASITLKRLPTVRFPVSIAVIRVQGREYRTHSTRSRGPGRFTVVTVRDIETEDDFHRLRSMARVSGLGLVTRLVVPSEVHSFRDLRWIADKVQSPMALLYTFDTSFRFGDNPVAPLTVLTLGMLPAETAHVDTTASAVLIDTQTGYIYGSAQATASQSHPADAWTSAAAAEQSRRRVEREAFDLLLTEIEHMWSTVVTRFGG